MRSGCRQRCVRLLAQTRGESKRTFGARIVTLRRHTRSAWLRTDSGFVSMASCSSAASRTSDCMGATTPPTTSRRPSRDNLRPLCGDRGPDHGRKAVVRLSNSRNGETPRGCGGPAAHRQAATSRRYLIRTVYVVDLNCVARSIPITTSGKIRRAQCVQLTDGVSSPG